MTTWKSQKNLILLVSCMVFALTLCGAASAAVTNTTHDNLQATSTNQPAATNTTNDNLQATSANQSAAANTTHDNLQATSVNQAASLNSTPNHATSQTTSNTKASKSSVNKKLPDPQLYRNGVFVASYTTIAAAISAAISGDTIMLEDGAIFDEHSLLVDKNLTFNVINNGTATIDGQHAGPVFIINNGVTVSLMNLIIENGQGILGGGIYNNGTLTVTNCKFTGNSAQDGGAIYNDATITVDNTTPPVSTLPPNGGTLTVINSTFTGNTATGNGGAIYNGGLITINHSTLDPGTGATTNGGTATITGSVFTGNSALNGGAIYNDATIIITNSSTLTSANIVHNGGTLTIDNSTLVGNTATGNGGAIYNGGTITIANSTLTTSTATDNGGVLKVTNSTIMNNTALNGGAIYNEALTNVSSSTLTDNTARNGGTFTITNNTISGNSASNDGGALDNDALINATNNTFTTNTLQNGGGTLTITDNTITGNTAPNGAAIYNNASIIDVNNSGTNTVANGGTVTATPNWWGSNLGPAPGDIAGNQTTTVIGWLQLNMNITNTASNTSPNVGQQYFYTITVTNNGPDTATDVQVADGIPAGLTFNNYTASQGIYNHATEIWNVGPLASGSSAVLQIFVTPTASVAGTNVTKNATLINTGTIASSTVFVTTPVSNVTLTKTASNSLPNVGQQYFYTITANNSGAADATGVNVTDTIPAGLTFNSYTASQGTYNSVTGIWNVGTIVSGASAVLQLFVTPTASVAGTTVTNNATIPGQTASATVVVPITPVSNVTLTKTASNLAPKVGQQYFYTITATNSGAADAAGVNVTDTIPAGLTFNSYTASQGTYNSVTGIWNVGTIVSGASAVLQLFVTPTASVAGSTLINSATIPGQIASATVVVPVTPVSNVTLTKTASNLAPNVGQQFSYTITATNSGAADAAGVNVTDTIPAGLTFNSYTASQGTYNSTTGIWNVGTIISGASAVLQLFVTPTASVAGTTLINSATIPGQIASATVVVPVTPVSNVTLTKTASNLAPNVGQQFSYTITATNSGAADAAGVNVTDTIPAGLTFNSYTASQGTYNSTTGIWNVGTIISGASAVLQLFVTPTASVAGTTLINSATIPGQIASATVVVPTTPVSNVTLTKTASNLAPKVGQQFSYTITATNSGAADAAGVNVTDTIPAGLTFNSYTASQGTYNSTTGIWNVGTIISGASAVLQLFVTPTASVAGTTLINSATIPGQIASATVVVPVTPVSNVTLTKTASNLAPNVGQQFSYTITATNSGAASANNVNVTDTIPAGLTFNSYTASQGTYNSVTGIWNVGTIVSGASAVLQLFVTPTASVAGTTLINSATIPGQIASATVVVPVTPVSNVTLTKTASNLAPNVGQQFNYTITATNSGAASANNVNVTDTIPAGLTFNSYTASQGTYNSTTGIWNVGTIISGASAVLQLFVTPTASVAGTTLINSATIPGQIVSATVVVPTVPVSNVTLTKTASNSLPNVGQQFQYTITATNSGAASANNVTVTDKIPAGLTFNSYTASQGTYNSATGIWNVGTIISGANAVLQLFVTPTASVAGSTLINSATIPGQIVSATVVVPTIPVSNVTLTKTASNLAPNVGQQFHYTITATNSGAGTANNVTVTDKIPAGLTFNSYTASQGTYNSATGIWNIGTLISGASAVLQLFVTPTASVAGSTLINSATIPGQIVSATVVVPTVPVSNVTLTKTASNSSPNVGQQFNYTITATNSGVGTANNVNVTDTIPAGLTFNSYTASQGTYNSATGIWNVGTLISGASAVLKLFVTPTASIAGKNVTNNATISGHTVSATVHVPEANVVLTKTASNSSPKVGQQFHYTITATNNGPDTATGVQVTDKIPAGLTFNSYTASQGTYNSVTGIWNIGTIVKGASAVLKLFVTPTASAAGKNVTNTATITANEFNKNKTTASVTIHVRSAHEVHKHHVKQEQSESLQSNASGQTVPMQNTGTPLMPLLLGFLMIMAGFANNARKKL